MWERGEAARPRGREAEWCFMYCGLVKSRLYSTEYSLSARIDNLISILNLWVTPVATITTSSNFWPPQYQAYFYCTAISPSPVWSAYVDSCFHLNTTSKVAYRFFSWETQNFCSSLKAIKLPNSSWAVKTQNLPANQKAKKTERDMSWCTLHSQRQQSKKLLQLNFLDTESSNCVHIALLKRKGKVWYAWIGKLTKPM